jgi:Helicase
MARYLPLVRAKVQTPSAVQLMINFGIEPDDWQVQVLTSRSSRLLLNCSRQSGKSTTLGAMALATACAKSSALVLCLAPALRQAQELFGKLIALYEASSDRLPPLTRLSELRAQWANRSRVLVIPADEKKGVRGFSRPDLVIVDECAGVADDVLRAARPLFALGHGRFVLSSTPRGRRGLFFEEWSSGIGWARWEIPASMIARISADFLASERQALGVNWYLQEYQCAFLQPLLAVFDYEKIDAAADEDLLPLRETPLFRSLEAAR